MQQLKIIFFEATYDCPFPEYRSLTPQQCNHLRQRIAVKLGLPENADGLAVLESIALRQVHYPGVNASSEGFTLRGALDYFAVALCDRVFVNWYRFDEIDELSLRDVVSAFSDLWYPASDDIELFDDTLEAVLSVRHDGVVSCYKYCESSPGD